jgi:tetratricopeptide (TPR) repeat protein
MAMRRPGPLHLASLFISAGLSLLPALSQAQDVSLANADADALRLRIIVVASRSKAERLLASIKAGEDFAALAKRESIDPAAAAGGYLGVVHPRVLQAEVQEALEETRPGQTTGVVVVPTGYAILQVLPNDEKTARGPAPPSAADFSVAGPQFNGVRYPPYTGGAIYVEGLFRMLPKPPGWNSDLRAFCELHQATLPTATDRIQTLLTHGDPDPSYKPTAKERMQAHYMGAILESYQGNMARALELWQIAYQISLEGVPDNVPSMEEVLGDAYLHKAEMDNGLYRHPDDRCIFPPRPGVSYPRFSKTEDAERAIQHFEKYLDQKPDEPEVEWLLNLAYMYLGKYPDGVPGRYRLAPALFKSKEDLGRFVDVAPDAGLTGRTFISGAMLVDDFDGDGLLDIITSAYDACDHVYYFHNDGDGTFSDRSAVSGMVNVAGGQGLVQADYNNDGCMDILVLRGAWQSPLPLSLLKNNCDGTFTEVTRPAGLRDDLYQTQTAVWTDIDNDGWVDLFIGNEDGPTQLFHNERDGTFKNISRSAGIQNTTFVKGVAAEDYDNDGYPDLFVSNIRGASNFLYQINHDGTFTEVSEKAGVGQSTASFTTWFFDYDNDGWPDLFVASDYASVDETMRTYLGRPRSTPPSKLYRNRGDGTFEDVASTTGLDNGFMPMGANFGDVDNDGFLDIYLGTGAPDYGSMAPKVLLRNDGGRTFKDVTDTSGLGELHKMHGIAFADMENRGHQDIVASMGGAVPGDAHALRLFRNPGNGNDWINVKLVGVKTNRAAIGARLKVTVDNKGTGVRSIHRTVNCGGSFGASPLAQEIGLGPAARILSLEVVWPVSHTRQVFKNVPIDQFLEIKELAPTYARLERKPYRLGRTPAGAATTADGSMPERRE